MCKRIRRIALGMLLITFIWCVILGALIWRYGTYDHAEKADCIIVLGAAVQGTTPSPVFEERILHGINLYRAGQAPKLLFTGGIGDGLKQSEGNVARAFAIQKAVPAADILIEERSRTTCQNLSEAKSVMMQHGLKTAILVSDPLHMKRTMLMADGLGIHAVSSPTPTTRYRSLRAKLSFLVREIYFYHHYLVTGN